MKRLRREFLTAEQGGTAIEYAMLAATLSVPVLLVFAYLADDAFAIWDIVSQRLTEVTDRIRVHL